MSAWERYADEPMALYALTQLLRQEIGRDPANAEWYRREIAEIEARLDRLAACKRQTEEVHAHR